MGPGEAIPAEPEVRGPWLGLESYSERHAALFFGREREIEEMLRLLGRRVLAVLFGPSGIGKSSLLQAGLFPRLAAEGYLPVYVRLDYAQAAPPFRQQVVAHIRTALAAKNISEEETGAVEDATVWEYLYAAEFYNKRKLPVTPVLCFDQFEEVFTIGQRTRISAEFLRELTDLVENYVPDALRTRIEDGKAQLPARYGNQPYRIVLALREDFVHRLDRLRREIPSVMLNRYPLLQMNGDQALEAVLKPGAQIVTEDVARSIVRFVAGANLRDEKGEQPARQDGGFGDLQVEPALLSVVCSELNSRCIRAGEAQITHAQLTTGQNNILDDFYTRSFDGLPPRARVFVEEELIDASGFRIATPVEGAGEKGLDEWSLQRLVARRLIRIEQRLDRPHVELTHDLLTRVVQASRDARTAREQEEARAAQLKHVRRQLLGVTLLAGMILAFAVFAAYSWLRATKARVEAEVSAREALADAAERNLAIDPEKSAPLALYAAQSSNTKHAALLPLAEEALHDAILESQVRAVLPGNGEVPVLSVVFSPDGKRVGAGRADGSVSIFDLASKREKQMAGRHGDQVNEAAFSPDGRLLGSASNDGTAKIWDAGTGAELLTFRAHKGAVNGIAFSPQGAHVATGSDDSLVKIWDARTGEVAVTMRSAAAVNDIAFSTDGSLLAGGGGVDGAIDLWELPAGRRLRRFGGKGAEINSIRFASDAGRLVTAGPSGAVIWEVGTGKELLPLPHRGGRVTWAAYGFRSRFVATCEEDGLAILRDASSGDELMVYRGHSGAVNSIAFSPDDRSVATGGKDGAVRIWSTEKTELGAPGTYDLQPVEVNDVAFSPDSRLLALARNQGSVRIWDTARNQQAGELRVCDSAVTAVAFSGDGKYVAAAGRCPGKIWQVDGFQETAALPDSQHAINALAFSPDGRFLIEGADEGTVIVLETAGWKMVRTFQAHTNSISDVAFGGTTLATGSADGHVVLWDSGTWRNLRSIDAQSQVAGVAFSPDGRRLAAGLSDGNVRMYDPYQGKLLAVLAGNKKAPLHRVRFSPDGKRLATSSDDKTVRIWDVFSGDELFSLKAHREAVNAVAFSPDNRRLASGSNDGTAQIYVIEPGELVRLARQRIVREQPLAPEDCRRYMHVSVCPALP